MLDPWRLAEAVQAMTYVTDRWDRRLEAVERIAKAIHHQATQPVEAPIE